MPKILFRVRVGPSRGMGHVYRSLRLAQELDDYESIFCLVGRSDKAHELVRSSGFDVIESDNVREALRRAGAVEVVCNDMLNTTDDDVAAVRAAGAAVVTLEDLGPGARQADWVINALIDTALPDARVSNGGNFAVMRAEFVGMPEPIIREHGLSVVVSFGGSDPSRLTPKYAPALATLGLEHLRIITGLEHQHWTGQENFDVVANPASIAAEFSRADVVVTTAGRTVFEAAALGIPVISIAANEKELTHSHTRASDGVEFLGLHENVTGERLANVVNDLLANHSERTIRSQKLRQAVDGMGVARIADGIRMIATGTHPFDVSDVSAPDPN